MFPKLPNIWKIWALIHKNLKIESNNKKKTEKLSALVKRKHAELESDEDGMMDEDEERTTRAKRNFENRKRSASRSRTAGYREEKTP